MAGIDTWAVRQWALVPLLAYLALGALVVTGVPPWEAPDEPAHVAYAEALAAGRRPTTAASYEAHQPPGYYLWPAWALRLTALPLSPLPPDNAFYPFSVAALVHRPSDPTAANLRLLRTLSGFLGLLTVCLAWTTSRAIWPGSRGRPFLAAMLVALWPQYQFIAHAISNDVLASAAGGLVVYGMVLTVVRPARAGVGLVLALAGLVAGIFVKLTVLGLAPACGLVWLWAWARRARHGKCQHWWRRGLGPWRRSVLLGLALMALVLGGRYLSLGAELRRQSGELVARALRVDPHLASLPTLMQHGRATLLSFWSHFGWQNLDPPPVVILAGILLAGVATARLSRLWRFLPASQRHGVAVSFLALTSAGAAVAKNLLARPEPQGRFLFPALVAAAVLLSAGLCSLDRRTLGRWTVGAICGLAAIDILLFAVWIPSAYTQYGLPPQALALRRIEAPPSRLVRIEPGSPAFRQQLASPSLRVARLWVAVARTSGPGFLEMRLLEGGSVVAERRLPLVNSRAHRWVSLEVVPPRTLGDPSLEVRLLGDGWAWLWAMQPAGVLGDAAHPELMLLVASQAPPWRAAP